jgi:hypothetical protein
MRGFRRVAPVSAISLVLSVAAASVALAQPSPRTRVAIDETLSAASVLAAALQPLPARRPPFPVDVRIVCRLADVTGSNGEAMLAELDRRLAQYAASGVSAWLAIEIDAAADADVAGRADAARRLSGRAGARVSLYEIVLPGAGVEARSAAFAVKQVAVELRAGAGSARVALGGVDPRQGAERLAALYREDVASYLDGVVVVGSDTPADGAAIAGLAAVVSREDPGAFLGESGRRLLTSETLLATELDRLTGPFAATSYGGDAAAVRAALARATPIADLLSTELVPIDASTSSLALSPESARGTLVYDAGRFATTLVYRRGEPEAGVSAADVLDVSLTLRSSSRPTIRDPFSGERLEAASVEREAAGNRLRLRVPLRDHPLIVDFNDGLSDVVTERTDVAGRSELSVGEIIARHQQARAAQDRLLASYVVQVRMQQHFRPTSTDPGFDVVTDNRYFADREGVEWEELSFSVNGTKWGSDRPPFPLLQPEKVLSPPLDLTLAADYRYRLEGTASVAGVRCYVVQFEPITRDATRYRGTVWIDAVTFRRVKLQATQTSLSAPVVSNEEVLQFALAGRIDDRDVFLPAESVSRQIVLIAGRNILVEKSSSFRDYELNPSDFAGRRLEARRGARIMYRDTDRGIRYFVKEGDTRVVSERATTRAKAMAIGTTIDPSYGYPLPIFGINYLNFEFGGKDSQLAMLFAGVLALGNIQKPKLAGTPLDGSVDFFAIAVPSSDKVYSATGERAAERILTWPLSTGANLGYQFTSFQKVSAGYQFLFNGYLHDRTTAEDYVTPSSTTTHGFGAGYEYRRGGYSVVANGTWFGRASWRPWGPAAALIESPRTYTKYSLGVTKEYFLSVFSKLRVNAAYFGGQRLDRFSQYQFGLFDETKIHGVPASGVRYGELAMLRGSYSFNVFEQYRFDVFLEGAVGRDRDASHPAGAAAPSARDPWEPITGIGASFSLRAPWNTILRSDIGKSFLPDRYRENGSVVVQIMLLKPL